MLSRIFIKCKYMSYIKSMFSIRIRFDFLHTLHHDIISNMKYLRNVYSINLLTAGILIHFIPSPSNNITLTLGIKRGNEKSRSMEVCSREHYPTKQWIINFQAWLPEGIDDRQYFHYIYIYTYINFIIYQYLSAGWETPRPCHHPGSTRTIGSDRQWSFMDCGHTR